MTDLTSLAIAIDMLMTGQVKPTDSKDTTVVWEGNVEVRGRPLHFVTYYMRDAPRFIKVELVEFVAGKRA